jgi:hypothetical protein
VRVPYWRSGNHLTTREADALPTHSKRRRPGLADSPVEWAQRSLPRACWATDRRAGPGARDMDLARGRPEPQSITVEVRGTSRQEGRAPFVNVEAKFERREIQPRLILYSGSRRSWACTVAGCHSERSEARSSPPVHQGSRAPTGGASRHGVAPYSAAVQMASLTRSTPATTHLITAPTHDMPGRQTRNRDRGIPRSRFRVDRGVADSPIRRSASAASRRESPPSPPAGRRGSCRGSQRWE